MQNAIRHVFSTSRCQFSTNSESVLEKGKRPMKYLTILECVVAELLLVRFYQEIIRILEKSIIRDETICIIYKYIYYKYIYYVVYMNEYKILNYD